MPLRPSDVPISTPCQADFDAMDRVQGGWHCRDCATDVVDLEACTEAEAWVVAERRRQEPVCVRYRVARDGTVMTRRDPVVPASVLLRKARPFTLAAAATLMMGCGSRPVERLVDRLPHSAQMALFSPRMFARCLADPHCDVTRPPAVAGGG